MTLKPSKSVGNLRGRLAKQNGVPWGHVLFGPTQYSNNNRFVIGYPGSGKTLTFRLVMAAQLPWPSAQPIPQTYDHGLRVHQPDGGTPFGHLRQQVYQSIVYDAKSEQVTRLIAHGFTPGIDLLILNPLDKRCMVWDIARDVYDPIRAKEFAALIVSDMTGSKNPDGTSQHFNDTAKRVIFQVVQVLQKTKSWRLRDLVNAFESESMIREVLKQHPEGGDSIAHIRDTPEGQSAFSTIKRYLGQFTIVAASWDAIERQHGKSRLLSLSEWVNSGKGSVLLLPDGDEYGETTRPFNRFLFKRLTKLMLSPTEKARKRQRTVFIDELPTAGKLTALPALLTKGRDYGVSVMIGCQDIRQMYDEYGQNGTEVIVNSCAYRAYLRCLGENAHWCSRQVGRQWIERAQPNTGSSHGDSSGQGEGFNNKTRVWLDNHSQNSNYSQGITMVQQEQDAVMPALFMNFKDIKATGVIQGLYSHPGGRTWAKSMALGEVLSAVAYEEYSDELHPEDFIEISSDAQTLRTWKPGDCRRIGLPESILEERSDNNSNHKEKTAPKRRKRRKQQRGLPFKIEKNPPKRFGE